MTGELVRSLFDNVVLRRPTPFVLLFEPSQRCDCRCPFCYHWREQEGGELPLETIRSVLDEAALLGCRSLFLNGGEPLIAPHLMPTLEHARQRGYRVVVTTNASRLADRAEEIAPFVERLSVSLDFPDERHDALRRKRGLFRAVVDGILEAQRVGIEARIATNVFEENVEDLPALARLARDLGVRLHARLLTNESAALDNDGVLKDRALRARVAEALRSLKREGYPIATPERYLRAIEHAAADEGADRPDRKTRPDRRIRVNPSDKLFTCRIARFVINIDAQGRVYPPCPRHEGTKDLVFGRVGEGRSLADIWYGPEAERFRETTLTCRPGVDCLSACVHDVSRLLAPDPRFWAEELLDGTSLSRFYLDGLGGVLNHLRRR